MRTQNKENYYYFFWVIAMVAFIAPQVMTAIAYHKLADILSKPIQVELVSPLKFRLRFYQELPLQLKILLQYIGDM